MIVNVHLHSFVSPLHCENVALALQKNLWACSNSVAIPHSHRIATIKIQISFASFWRAKTFRVRSWCDKADTSFNHAFKRKVFLEAQREQSERVDSCCRKTQPTPAVNIARYEWGPITSRLVLVWIPVMNSM